MPPITCTSFLDFVKEAVWENSPKPCLKSPGRPFFAFLALGPLQTAGIPTWFCPFEAHLSCLQAIRSIPTVQTRQKKRDMHPATQAPDTLFPALFPSTWNFPVFSGRGSVSRFEGAPPYPVFFTAPFSALSKIHAESYPALMPHVGPRRRPSVLRRRRRAETLPRL